MHNYLVSYKGVGDAVMSTNIQADKVYHSDAAVTFYCFGTPVAAFSADCFVRYIRQPA